MWLAEFLGRYIYIGVTVAFWVKVGYIGWRFYILPLDPSDPFTNCA